MDCVLLGPSDRSVLWRHGKISKAEYHSFVQEYANFIAKNFDNLIIAPDDGVYTDVALKFQEITNRKAIAYYPDKDKFYGIEHIKKNLKKFDSRPINGDWYKLNADLAKQGDVVICLGFTPGVMIEISYIKYHQKWANKKISVFVDERAIGSRLPESVTEEIKDFHYVKNSGDIKLTAYRPCV